MQHSRSKFIQYCVSIMPSICFNADDQRVIQPVMGNVYFTGKIFEAGAMVNHLNGNCVDMDGPQKPERCLNLCFVGNFLNDKLQQREMCQP